MENRKGFSPRDESYVWSNRLLPLFGAVMFLYVGTENAIAGWVASYAKRLEGPQQSFWALTPSFFWASLMLGRVITPALLRHMPETRLVLAGLAVATTGATILISTKTMMGLFIGATIAGTGLAPIFPTTVAMFTHYFGMASPRISGLMFALGGLGGATIPWMVGFVSTTLGSLRSGLVFPLIGGLTMMVLQIPIYRSLSFGCKKP